MSLPPLATVYTFNSIEFVRVLESTPFQPWLFGEIQYTLDAVLGGTDTYLDVGADVAPPLSFRALVANTTDRLNLRNSRGTTGALTNTRGRTDTVTLVKATPIDGPQNQLYIDLTFVLRP